MGTVLTAIRTITNEDNAAFGRLTGDFGSHHVSGVAGRPVAYGLLTLALAPLFLRDGVHMSELSVKFLAPVFAGDTITATVEIVDMAGGPDDQVNLSCEVKVVNSEGETVLKGRVRVQVVGADDSYLPIGSR